MHRKKFSRVLAAAVVFMSMVLVQISLTPAKALVACNTNAQNSYTMAASHGKVFYIDTGVSPVLDAGYIGYRFTNATGSTKSNLWVSVGNFTGGKLGLVNTDDQYFRLADVTNNSTVASYFMLKATSGTSTAQTHDVKLWDKRPDATGANVLYQCTYSFSKVQETIKAAANKVADNSSPADNVAISASTSSPKLGETVNITVEGTTGTIGKGSAPDNSMVWLTPAAVSTWPTRALRLESVSVVFDTNSNWSSSNDQRTYTDTLFIANANANTVLTTSAEYRATYTFRVIGRPASTVKAVPVTEISSGTQVKHADTGAAGATVDLSFSSFTIDAAVNKSVQTTSGLTTVACSSNSCSSWGGINGTTYMLIKYRLVATTASATTTKIDEIVDVPASGALYYSDGTHLTTVTDVNNTSATWTAPVQWSSESAVSPRPQHFVGPFSMTSAKSVTLDYWMAVPNVTGTYSNKAYALVGSTPVGTSGSAMSKVEVSATTGATSVTANTTTESFPIDAVTQPASSMSTSGAVLNGTVDPNGTATLTGQFEYSTNAELSSPTTVTATTPASGTLNGLTAPTPVAVTLTGLSSYTTYYYRVKAGSTYGGILNFTTLGVAATPTATTDSSGPNSSTAATLNGTVTPNMTNIVAVQFLYGTSNTLATSTPVTVDDSSNPGTPLTLGGMSSQPVAYLMAAGTISAGTTYYYKVRACTAGSGTTSSYTCTSFVDGSIVSFTTGTAPTVATSSLPSTLNGAAYSATLTGTGGSGTYTTWTRSSGTLPSGITLDASTGVLAGTVTASAGTYTFGVKVTDSFNIQSVEKSLSIVVLAQKSDQTITFATIADRTYSTNTFTVTPTASSLLPVSLVSSTVTVCDVAATDAGGYDVYMYTTGTCSLSASQSGNGAYNAATNNNLVRSFAISKNNQTVTYQPPNKSYLDPDFIEVATTSASSEGFTPTYSGGTTNVCGITSSGLISILGAGTCSVRADFPGNDSYNTGTSGTVTFTIAKKSQTVSLSQSGVTFGVSPLTLNGSTNATGSGSLTHSSSTPLVCTVTGATATIVGAGDCTVTAEHPGNGNWNSGSRTITFAVAKKNQTVSFSQSSVTYLDADWTGNASTDATGDGSLTYSTSTPAVCTIVGGKLHIVAAGDCTATVDHPGNGNWNPGSRTITFTVDKKNQTVTFSPSGKVFGDPNFNLDATTTATGAGSITFSSTTTSVCTVSTSGAVTIEGAGDCIVTANHPGNGNYNSGTSGAVTFAVAKKNQTVTFTPSSRSLADGTYNVSAAASTDATGTGSITYSGDDNAVCSVATNGTVTLKGLGTCHVTASHPGNGNWNSGSTNASFEVTNKYTQTLNFSQTNKTYGNDPFSALATTDATGDGSISFTSSTPSVCSVTSAGLVTLNSAGDCTLTAAHPGNGSYNSASKSVTFNVGKKNQAVTFTQSAVTYGVSSFSAGATSTASVDGGSITYTSSTGSVCSVSLSGTISILAAGSCTLRADHPGNGNYNSGNNSVTFAVNKKDQTVTFTQSAVTYGASNFAPRATSDAEADGEVLTYTSSTDAVCTIVSGEVHIVAAGDCTLRADHPGNGNWNSGFNSVTFAVNKKNQTVSFTQSDVTYLDDDWTGNGSTDATGDGSITYTSSTTGVCTVVSGKIHTVAAGSCTVTADHPGNGNWNSGSRSVTFNVGKKNQTVSFTQSDVTYLDDDWTGNGSTDATGDGSITYTSSTTGVCTVVSGKIHTVAAGSCTVTADHPGNGNWNSGSRSVTFNVGKKNQSISFSPPNKTLGDPDFTPAPLTDTELAGVSFTFSSSTTSVCTIESGKVRMIAAGTCSLTTNHAGNGNWNSGSKSASFTVGRRNQTISMGPFTATFGDPNLDPAASSDATADGETISYTTQTSSVCDIVGNQIRVKTAGTCTVTAEHPGNTNWNSGSKSETFTVAKKNQTVTFTETGKTFGSGVFNAAASTNATGGGTFSYTSSTPSVCTVTAGGSVTIVDVGTCTLVATHSGNTNWNGNDGNASFVVGKGNQTITFNPASKNLGDPDFDLGPGTTADSGTFSYTSSTPSVCTVTPAGRITLVGVGTCTVTASHTGNTRWNPDSSVKSFSVGPMASTTTTVAPPTTVAPTTTIAPATTTIAPTTTVVDPLNVGNVSGTLWFDVNKNGRMDKGEPPVPGATVELKPNDQVAAAGVPATPVVRATAISTVTDKSGAYTFVSVPVGNYKVAADFPKSSGLVAQMPISINGTVTVAPAKEAVVDMPTVGVAKTAGVTVDSMTTQTISRAPVTCIWFGFDKKLGTEDDVQFAAKSDADGNYIIDGIPAGEFSCKAKNPETGVVSDARSMAVSLESAAIPLEEVKPLVLDMGTTKLAKTGTDPWHSLMLGVSLVLLGVLALGSRRRRSA